jgi:hypothetical protein
MTNDIRQLPVRKNDRAFLRSAADQLVSRNRSYAQLTWISLHSLISPRPQHIRNGLSIGVLSRFLLDEFGDSGLATVRIADHELRWRLYVAMSAVRPEEVIPDLGPSGELSASSWRPWLSVSRPRFASRRRNHLSVATRVGHRRVCHARQAGWQIESGNPPTFFKLMRTSVAGSGAALVIANHIVHQ